MTLGPKSYAIEGRTLDHTTFEEAEKVEQELRQMPKRQQKKWVLRELKDLTHGETAILRIFGQTIMFPCNSPRQFWRAAQITAHLTGVAVKAERQTRKLETQLLEIQRLQALLYQESTIYEERQIENGRELIHSLHREDETLSDAEAKKKKPKQKRVHRNKYGGKR